MATLIPNYNWTDFLKVMKLGQLHRLKSGEVMYNGEYLFTFVNGNVDSSGYLRLHTESRAQITNGVCGETLEQILEKESVTA